MVSLDRNRRCGRHPRFGAFGAGQRSVVRGVDSGAWQLWHSGLRLGLAAVPDAGYSKPRRAIDTQRGWLFRTIRTPGAPGGAVQAVIRSFAASSASFRVAASPPLTGVLRSRAKT